MQRFYIGSTYYSVTMQQCWINVFVHHAKTASSSGASFFAWQRRARSEWLVMNRNGPWEGYRRQAKRRLARCLLPAFLCAHVLKRDVWVRGRCNNVGPICCWTRCKNPTLDQHVSPTLCNNVGYIRPAWRVRYINGFFLEILATISIIIELIFYGLLHWLFQI